jgi:hypothetical protein
MKPGELVVVPSSTFTTEKVLERGDLQRLLRARIDAIADDVLIVAEEFGAFADAAGFGREITTTVLWLTDLYGLDIRCVRLTPYRVGDRLLLEVQQVIPLPEASELIIQLRRKATQERAVRSSDGRDWTQYVITGPAGEIEPLRKRQAVLAMVTTLRDAGVPAREIAEAIPPLRFLPVDGTLAGAELREAFALAYPKGDPVRWFMESPVHDEGRTWIVTKMWGRNTEPVLELLAKLAPEQSGIGYEAVP